MNMQSSLAPHLFWTDISEDEEGAKADARLTIKAYRKALEIAGVGGADAKLAAGAQRLVNMTFDQYVTDEEAIKIVDDGLMTIKMVGYS